MIIEVLDQASEGYAGNVKPETAWQTLCEDQLAQLVDVRTTAEWAYVGMPDLSSLGRELIRVDWQSFPDMQVDQAFAERVSQALRATGANEETPIFFICRSGARSARAAAAATAAGWRRAYNIASGFEGDRNEENHRGTVSGWKVDGLPWVQS